jgi:hypothetical protein
MVPGYAVDRSGDLHHPWNFAGTPPLIHYFTGAILMAITSYAHSVGNSIMEIPYWDWNSKQPLAKQISYLSEMILD